MATDFIKAVRDDFTGLVINANTASVKRAEFGFVNKDCDFIKSMLGTICLHAIDNPDIFTEKQSNNIINLINTISHG